MEPCARLRQPTGIPRCRLRPDLDVAVGYVSGPSLPDALSARGRLCRIRK